MDILNLLRSPSFKRLLMIVGLCMTTAVHAIQNDETDASVTNNSSQTNLIRPQVASLVSSPGRCELKSGNSVCQMTMSLIWEAPSIASYCIWHQSQANPIKCWDNAWQGSVRLKFKSSQKTNFVLKAKDDQTELAQTIVAVTASYKQRKRAQRRKRGFWRMF